MTNAENIDCYILSLIENFVQIDLDEAPIVTGKEAEEDNESPNHIEEPSGNDDVDNVEDLLDGDVSDNEEEVYDGDSFQELGEDFEGLPWDVQCTAEFWKKLKDPRLESNIKVIILRKVKLLASGDWRRRLAIKLQGPQGMLATPAIAYIFHHNAIVLVVQVRHECPGGIPIYNSIDVDCAYNKFLDDITSLVEKHCPQRGVPKKN